MAMHNVSLARPDHNAKAYAKGCGHARLAQCMMYIGSVTATAARFKFSSL